MQRKISKSLGRDTHVRSMEVNMFQEQSVSTFEIKTGEVFLSQPEPTFKQNMVSVSLTKGGRIDGIGIPGGFIEPITGNLHGLYEGLIPGQMVTVGFVDGNSAAPIILNRYPYQGKGNTLFESSYITPMYLSGYDSSDVILGHISGSAIGLYTGLNVIGGRLPGSIGIDAFTECNITANTDILIDAIVSAEVKSTLVKLTGTTQATVSAPLVSISGSTKAEISAPQITIDGSATVEINGNVKNFVTHLELDTALQLYVTAINALFATKLDGSGTAGTVVLDISASKTLKVLTG